MNPKMPRTPFCTPLSGSARLAELRIRNIFAGPKKRPPAIFIVLVSAFCLLSGNLVSCQQRPAEPTLVMETQYYDSYANYLEIPVLALPAGEENQAVDAINAALNGLREEYALQLETASGGAAWENQCLFYPSTTDRYLNLLFFRSRFTTDLNTGHVFSLVYDRKKGTAVSAEEALALAGLNEKGLLDQVTEQVQLQIDRDSQEYGFLLALHNLTLEGFRVKADGQPVFYLTGRVDDVDDDVLDNISGADQLYIWADRAVTTYNQYSAEPVPLVPAEETDQLSPPLWNQWYFAGEEPAGGFVDKSLLEPAASQDIADLRAVLMGDMTFTNVETGQVLNISRVTEAVTSDASVTARPARFAYVDIDWDGTSEVVLWLTTQEGDPALAFLVLRWQEGVVYSYLRFPRWLADLKEDGVHFYSISGEEFGVNLVHFADDGPGRPERWETETLLSQELSGDGLAWYYGTGPISEADFHILYQEQQSKTNVTWYEFTAENIAEMIS